MQKYLSFPLSKMENLGIVQMELFYSFNHFYSCNQIPGRT